jgi:hypothetical protein
MSSALRNFAKSIPLLPPIVRAARRARRANLKPDFSGLSPLRFDGVEGLLIRLLSKRILWKVKNDWVKSDHPPHFSYNNYQGFILSFFEKTVGPYPNYRGFLSSQMISEGDKVLDISCGDGYFTKRFFAPLASRVDGIDIEPDAIAQANKYNADPNVRFYVTDAVEGKFPDTGYDVIVWDGGIAHFSKETNENMVVKIKAALKPGAIFCGSETLGSDGSEDHLQRWDTLEEVATMFRPHFKFVDLYETEYFYNLEKTGRRGEFYWRCSDTEAKLEAAKFRRF